MPPTGPQLHGKPARGVVDRARDTAAEVARAAPGALGCVALGVTLKHESQRYRLALDDLGKARLCGGKPVGQLLRRESFGHQGTPITYGYSNSVTSGSNPSGATGRLWPAVEMLEEPALAVLLSQCAT